MRPKIGKDALKNLFILDRRWQELRPLLTFFVKNIGTIICFEILFTLVIYKKALGHLTRLRSWLLLRSNEVRRSYSFFERYRHQTAVLCENYRAVSCNAMCATLWLSHFYARICTETL